MNHIEAGLGSLLRALSASLDEGVEQLYRMQGESFRPRYFPVVRLLLEHDALRVGALADACGVSQPAMTQTLAAMRKDGIVESTGGEDQRARLVSLTSRGRAQAARLQKYWSATARAAAQLEAECRTSLSAVARDYQAALQSKPFIDRIKEQL